MGWYQQLNMRSMEERILVVGRHGEVVNVVKSELQLMLDGDRRVHFIRYDPPLIMPDAWLDLLDPHHHHGKN
jgi:hypothetical protein